MNTRPSKRSTRLRSSLAMTLVEVLVTTAISTILFATLAMLWVNGARSLFAMVNYTELDQASKTALDTMSRDIRQARTMSAYSSSSISMTNIQNIAFSYTYNPTAKTLTRTYGGVSKVLLTGCDRLAFSVYQRTPTNNFYFAPAATLNEAKLVDVNWKCSRKIRGVSANTESIQTAKIVMRN
jgi:Tfp pilus assembly protein PilW